MLQWCVYSRIECIENSSSSGSYGNKTIRLSKYIKFSGKFKFIRNYYNEWVNMLFGTFAFSRVDISQRFALITTWYNTICYRYKIDF